MTTTIADAIRSYLQVYDEYGRRACPDEDAERRMTAAGVLLNIEISAVINERVEDILRERTQ